MSNNQMKFIDTTPKRVYFQNQVPQTTASTKVFQPMYNTPDRMCKSPFRSHAITMHSFNDTGELFRPQQQAYPPTYQSSQISLQNELNQAQQKIMMKPRDQSPYQESSMKLYTRIQNLEQDLQTLKSQKMKDDKELEEYKRFYREYYGNKTDTEKTNKFEFSSIKQLEDKLNRQPDSQTDKIIGLLKDQLNKLGSQLEDSKHKLQEQDTKVKDYERKIKLNKSQLKEKDREIEQLMKDLKVFEQKSISQQKMKEFIDVQLRDCKRIYSDLRRLNDEISEENTSLKMIVLQVDTYSLRSNFQSKKQSEQDFQINENTLLDENALKDLLDSYLLGNSDDLLQLTKDQNIHSIFSIFREAFHKLLSLNSSRFKQQDEGAFKLSEVHSAEFSKLKHHHEEIVGSNELQARGERILHNIKQKEHELNQTDDEQTIQILREEIQQLEKEFEGIQILITEQSGIFDKNNPNPHRNSVISFDQNFDTYEEQPY